MVFREGEDVVGGDVSHGLGVGGRGPEEADHLLHLWRWQRGGCHGPWQERGADLPGIVSTNLITMQMLKTNNATGETSPAITPFHFFDYNNSSNFYHWINFYHKIKLSQDI